jgi:hypothetical protein
MVDFCIFVNNEYLFQFNSHCSIRDSISIIISKPSLKRIWIRWEQVPNILQRSNLEYLRFLVNDFPLKRHHQSIRTHDQWPIRYRIRWILLNASQIVPCILWIPYWSWCQIQHIVPILQYWCKKLANPIMSPIFT